MSGCIGEPISFLRLERYGLGELSGREYAAVAQHLAACTECRACWARIEADAARGLPPWAASSSRPAPARARRITRFAWMWLGAASASVAGALLLWRAGPGLEPPGSHKQIKGGELSLELVRLGRDGRVWEPTHYHPDDRFKVLLTCPPPWRGVAEVLVYQDGRAYFPLATQTIEECGNRRSFAGAFRLDGTSLVRVCVATSETTLDRAELARGAGSLPEHSVCEEVTRDPTD